MQRTYLRGFFEKLHIKFVLCGLWLCLSQLLSVCILYFKLLIAYPSKGTSAACMLAPLI